MDKISLLIILILSSTITFADDQVIYDYCEYFERVDVLQENISKGLPYQINFKLDDKLKEKMNNSLTEIKKKYSSRFFNSFNEIQQYKAPNGYFVIITLNKFLNSSILAAIINENNFIEKMIINHDLRFLDYREYPSELIKITEYWKLSSTSLSIMEVNKKDNKILKFMEEDFQSCKQLPEIKNIFFKANGDTRKLSELKIKINGGKLKFPQFNGHIN